MFKLVGGKEFHPTEEGRKEARKYLLLNFDYTIAQANSAIWEAMSQYWESRYYALVGAIKEVVDRA